MKEKVDFSGFDEVIQDLRYLESVSVDFGFPDNEPHPSNPAISVATVAMYNNEGVKGSQGWKIPPRPFMDVAGIIVETRLDEFTNKIMFGLSENIGGLYRTLDYVAKEAGDSVREAIDTQEYVPLAESTIANKGHDTILIDSGVLYDAAKGEITAGDL
jgi:hypothetical protein